MRQSRISSEDLRQASGVLERYAHLIVEVPRPQARQEGWRHIEAAKARLIASSFRGHLKRRAKEKAKRFQWFRSLFLKNKGAKA